LTFWPATERTAAAIHLDADGHDALVVPPAALGSLIEATEIGLVHLDL